MNCELYGQIATFTTLSFGALAVKFWSMYSASDNDRGQWAQAAVDADREVQQVLAQVQDRDKEIRELNTKADAQLSEIMKHEKSIKALQQELNAERKASKKPDRKKLTKQQVMGIKYLTTIKKGQKWMKDHKVKGKDLAAKNGVGSSNVSEIKNGTNYATLPAAPSLKTALVWTGYAKEAEKVG